MLKSILLFIASVMLFLIGSYVSLEPTWKFIIIILSFVIFGLFATNEIRLAVIKRRIKRRE